MNDQNKNESGIDNIDPKLVIASISLEEKISSFLKKKKALLPEIDKTSLRLNLLDALLGKLAIKDAAGKIIEESVEYELVSPLLEPLFREVFGGVLPELKKHPVNQDPESGLFIDTLNSEMSREGQAASMSPKTTAQILSGLSKEPIKEATYADKEQILSEIEDPSPTVARPSFVLPNTKPSTSDVLKGISGSIPATMPTAFPPDLDLDIDTAGIIDPFKNAQSAETPAPAAAAPQTIDSPATPATATISDKMGAKLSGMTGSTASESFKIRPLSETMQELAGSGTKKPDPYREPIE